MTLPVCGVAVQICSRGTSSLGLFPFPLWSLFPFPGLPVWGNVLHCEICWRVSLISGFWLLGKWCSCWYWPLGPLGKICVHRRRLDVNLKSKMQKCNFCLKAQFWHKSASIRVHSRFEFQITHSNLSVHNLATDKKLSNKLFTSLIVLRSPQNFAKSPNYFWLALHRTKVRWRFRKILWPSQNIWTLFEKNNQNMEVKIFQSFLKVKKLLVSLDKIM